MALSKKKIKEYIKNPVICPYCGSNDIRSGRATLTDTSSATANVKCLVCKKKWTDVYKISDIKEEEEDD